MITTHIGRRLVRDPEAVARFEHHRDGRIQDSEVNWATESTVWRPVHAVPSISEQEGGGGPLSSRDARADLLFRRPPLWSRHRNDIVRRVRIAGRPVCDRARWLSLPIASGRVGPHTLEVCRHNRAMVHRPTWSWRCRRHNCRSAHRWRSAAAAGIRPDCRSPGSGLRQAPLIQDPPDFSRMVCQVAAI